MTVKSLKNMTALAFAAGVAILANAAPAKASVSVTYSTSAVFSGGNATVSGGGAIAKVDDGLGNTATLTFTGQSSVLVGPVPPATNASFGTITTSVEGTGGDFNDVAFSLTITQEVPVPSGDGDVEFTNSSQTLTGHISGTTNNLTLYFDDPRMQSISFNSVDGPGLVTYTVREAYDLVPPSTNSGVTTIQGQITATPEPGGLVLACAGLPLLGFAAWRRTRKNAI